MFVGMAKRTLPERGAIICGWCAVWLCAGTVSCAQFTQVPGPLPAGLHAALATNKAHAIPMPAATGRKLLSRVRSEKAARLHRPPDKSTQPATVSLRNGKLTVEASNSDLAQILWDISSVSGMTIHGLNGGPRVFGHYGPGNSREVLAALLSGAGYNFIMVGGASDGTPRELLLSSQSNNTQAITPFDPRLGSSADRDDLQQREIESNQVAPNASGPGAISPAASPDDQDEHTRVLQTLQRLLHMQEQPQSDPQ